MPHQPSTSPLSAEADPRTWAGAVVRPLSRRYLTALLAVAALLAIDQAVIQPRLVGLNYYAPVINLAGRQRMLSQKICKEVLALATLPGNTPQRRSELSIAIEQWTKAHKALLAGDSSIEQAQATRILKSIEPDLRAIVVAASEVADRGAARASQPDDPFAPVANLLEHESHFLQGMEEVVNTLEQAAQRRIFWLRCFGLVGTTFVFTLLAAVYHFVLRPADSLIREQLRSLADSEARHRLLATLLQEARDELEQRVEQRTRELQVANQALQREGAERQAAEVRMRNLSTELAHASRVNALGQLATGLAHEINQPLASITNYAETLSLAAGNRHFCDRERHAIDEIKLASLRAGAIIRKMRHFVRRGGAEMLPVEVNELTSTVCDLCQTELRNAGVTFAMSLPAERSWILADALQIQQVLVNLLHNAVQALRAVEHGARSVQIAVRVRDTEAQFEVTDTGPGFTQGTELAFAPFFTTKPDGLGVGLAISRTIVEQHRGRIWAENCPLGGAVVTFCLPLHEPRDAERELPSHRVCS